MRPQTCAVAAILAAASGAAGQMDPAVDAPVLATASLAFPAPHRVELEPLLGRTALLPNPDPAPLPPPPHHTRRAALFTLGAGVGIFGVLLLLPEHITGWSAHDRTWEGLQDEWRDFKRHVSAPPVWDPDHWFFNYVGHPYVGMHTYLMERNYGLSPIRGFFFSTAASVVFEYGIEAWAEPPSLQDLLTTSPLGSILGELNYQLTQHLRRGGLNLGEKVLVTLVNPVHVMQHGYR